MNKFWRVCTGLMVAMLLGVPAVAMAQIQQGSFDDGQTGNSMIRVGLWANQPNIIVSTDVDFNIVDSATHELMGRYAAKSKVTVTSREGVMFINNMRTGAASFALLPDTDGQDHLIEVNRHHYRGSIEIHRTHNKPGLTVVNTLPVDKYLYGVIPKEISPDWNIEVLKAQAVAARTYAIANHAKHNDDGYGVCVTTECQVYAGADSEAERTTNAVDETAGLALEYQGRLISAAFHSSSGGYTEDSENVWGSYTPYLRGIVDYDQNTPNYRWEKQISPAGFDEALLAGGYHIGHIRAFELSHFDGQPASQPDRGVSGRVKSLRIIGDSGSIDITGSKLRLLLGLHSTLFDIRIMIPNKQELDFDITDSYGRTGSKQVSANLPLFPVRKTPGDGNNIERLIGDPNELIVINGFGYGHGLGMSQWGAKAMADKAPTGDKAYFKQILKHYYQGVEVIKLY